MTCIVGLVHGDSVTIGGDSAGVSGWDLMVRKDEKVFVNGPCIMGFTSSFRMGQLLRYRMLVPAQRDGQATFEFMSTDFVDAVRTCLKNGGYAEKEKERESAGTFLVGYNGRLFAIHSDYQVAESVAGFDACGCGQSIAIGAMYGTGVSGDYLPRWRVLTALEAAERFSAGVRGPFNIITRKKEDSGIPQN